MTELLRTTGLSKRFGGHQAVSDVDLVVQRGEIHCLIGPNGAGKSTLFKLIVGTHVPSAGSITFDGHDVTEQRPFERVKRGMSIKMQTPSVFRELPVRQNVQIALQHHVPPAQLAEERDRLLELLDLSDRAREARRRAVARPAAVARDRHGAGAETHADPDGRAHRRHVARRNATRPAN